MPQTLIVIFLLFFAVLAAAWFYLQRAKSRPTPDTTPTGEAEVDDSTSAS
jgi:hypothetical protein